MSSYYGHRINLTDTSCEVCDWGMNGLTVGLRRHRLVPGKLGGEYTKENVITLCANCHAVAHWLMREYPSAHNYADRLELTQTILNITPYNYDMTQYTPDETRQIALNGYAAPGGPLLA